MGNVTSKLIEAYAEVNEKKKLDPVGQADADIDNDGDVDKSDKYLHNRRKAIKKAMDESKVECPKCDGEGCDHCDGKGYHMKEGYESVAKEMKKMHDEGYGKKAIMAKYNHMDNATLEKLYASSCGTREEVEESSKAALAKKLAKASAPSEKGKKAVTLKKAPWDKNEANNDEEVIMNPKKDKNKKAEAETMNTESVNLDESIAKHMSSYDAKEFLKKHKAHNVDFHALPASSASAMHDKAKEVKYKKSKSAPGSTGRMFHAALQRHADKLKESVNLDEDLTHQTVKPPSHTKKYSGKDHFDTNSIMAPGNERHTVTSSQADAHDKTAAHHIEVADAHKKAGEKSSSYKLQRLHHQASVHHKKAAEAHFNASHSSSGADKDGSIQKKAKDMHMAYHITMHANKMSQEARNKGTKAKRMNNENVLPPVYARILEEREKHYKGATKPEGMMDNSKSSKGAMDMVNQPKEINDDDEKGHEDASKAGRVGPSAKARPADNMKGDKKVIPSATPMKGK